jgi:hypothetical protein
MADAGRTYRAGHSVEDLCRACKSTRDHTIMAVSPDGAILRVVCGYCGSQHNYRGGGPATPRASTEPRASREPGGAWSLVSERERSAPPMDHESGSVDLELLLRRIIREEAGVTPVVPADKWRGGEVVLRPGKPGLQEKTWPIETLFHKIVMIRNRLRVLEQQVNGSELPNDQKVKLQAYITGCYGSLTSFNVLFADENDRFQGTEGKD